MGPDNAIGNRRILQTAAQPSGLITPSSHYGSGHRHRGMLAKRKNYSIVAALTEEDRPL